MHRNDVYLKFLVCREKTLCSYVISKLSLCLTFRKSYAFVSKPFLGPPSNSSSKNKSYAFALKPTLEQKAKFDRFTNLVNHTLSQWIHTYVLSLWVRIYIFFALSPYLPHLWVFALGPHLCVFALCLHPSAFD